VCDRQRQTSSSKAVSYWPACDVCRIRQRYSMYALIVRNISTAIVFTGYNVSASTQAGYRQAAQQLARVAVVLFNLHRVNVVAQYVDTVVKRRQPDSWSDSKK